MAQPEQKTPRGIADDYVRALAALDPSLAVRLGFDLEDDRLPDLSPGGVAAVTDLAHQTLTDLNATEEAHPSAEDAERRCASLLRERLTAELALRHAGEDFRTVGVFNALTLTSPTSSPLMGIRDLFPLMPTSTAQQWQVVGRRMERVPEALHQYRSPLAEGISRDLMSGPTVPQTLTA